jgi:hypothetical protein
MDNIGLSVDNYSLRIARTLSFMYWVVEVDMDGVEVVIGGKVKSADELQLWILDFDRCKNITMDTAGLEQAARAF